MVQENTTFSESDYSGLFEGNMDFHYPYLKSFASYRFDCSNSSAQSILPEGVCTLEQSNICEGNFSSFHTILKQKAFRHLNNYKGQLQDHHRCTF